jgi:tetratricopeptide (TPR) repeat protein
LTHPQDQSSFAAVRRNLTRNTRFLLAIASLAGALAFSAPALAQEAGDDAAPADDQAPADGEQPAEPELTPEQKQAKAVEIFKEGQALAKDGKYDEAVEKFEAAYALYQDPGILFLIGEAYQISGTEQRDFDVLQKSVDAYKKYLEAVPEGAGSDKARERITQLEESIDAERQRLQRIADEEAQAKLDAELAAKAEEEKRQRELAERKEMQVVLNAGAVFGADQQLSGILRMQGGALLSWEKFAIEGKVGIDGFLRVDEDQGVSARSLTLLDLGVRYGLNYRYLGPFFAAGASYGVFGGKPRERKLDDDMATCAGFDTGSPGQCAFNIDANIATRVGFGYGFAASKKTTVALRLEAQYWLFSVDEEQETGSPPAFEVDKPQSAVAVLLGLEFLRWL